MSRDPIERGLEIEQAQLRGFARTVAEVEWLLLILVVLYLFIANPALARSVGVLGVLLGFAAFVLLFRYARPFAKHTHFKLTLEILVDARVPDGRARRLGRRAQPARQSVSAADRHGRVGARQTRRSARRRAGVRVLSARRHADGRAAKLERRVRHRRRRRAGAVRARRVLDDAARREHQHGEEPHSRAVGSRRAHVALQHARVRAARRARARRGEPHAIARTRS